MMTLPEGSRSELEQAFAFEAHVFRTKYRRQSGLIQKFRDEEERVNRLLVEMRKAIDGVRRHQLEVRSSMSKASDMARRGRELHACVPCGIPRPAPPGPRGLMASDTFSPLD